MCLIINKPAGVEFNWQTLDNGWRMNPHGAGFMAYDKKRGRVVVEKGFFSLKSLWGALQRWMDAPVVVHLRWATHGTKDKKNCHPFEIRPDLAMVHNGIIDIEIKDKRYSDTWHFAKLLGRVFKDHPEFYLDPTLKATVERNITQVNKLVFMDAQGRVSIANEEVGTWLDGCWYSNTLFTFGSWTGFEKAQKRRKIIYAGMLTPPVKVSPFALNEGIEWFNCDNCYKDFFKATAPCIRTGEHKLCAECHDEIGWYIEGEFELSSEYIHDTNVVPEAEVDSVIATLKRLDEEKQQFALAQNLAEQAIEDGVELNQPTVVVESETETEIERKVDECCNH